MITTVKNNRGYRFSFLNLAFSVGCLGWIVYCGFQAENIKKIWFMTAGLIVSFCSIIHQTILITKRRAYTRINIMHVFLVTAYFLTMTVCIFGPILVTKEFGSLSEPEKTYATYLLMGYCVNLVPLLVLLISLYGRDDQLVQNFLHPYTEIIDGFSKSSGSIQMTAIPSTSVAVATDDSLKQVVIGDLTVDEPQEPQESQELQNQIDEDNSKDILTADVYEEDEILSAHKADGTSPKPSMVLKTWPKADPFPVRALYTFKTDSKSELPFRKGDTLIVLDCRGKWWQAQKDDRVGFIPSNYVSVLLKARVASTFTASEDDQVSITKDQVIEVMERYHEKCLVRTVEGKIGAVRTDRLEFLS